MQEADLKKVVLPMRREVHEARTYITEHYMEDFTWANVAEHVGLSGNYLRSLYAEVYEDSLNQTVTECRLRYAAELLTTTARQVQDISEESMFRDSAYFCRKFREWSGMTPTQFRKKNTCIEKEVFYEQRNRSAASE